MKGQFRDAKFIVLSHEEALGRRTIVHEFPLADTPYVEDLGGNSREKSFEAIIIGPGYKAAAAKLEAALAEPGPGRLIHPDWGSLNVTITSARRRQTSRELGKVTYSITCIPSEAKPRYPTEANDTAAQVAKAADKSLADSINDFADNFDVLGQAADYVQGVVDEIDNVFAAVENVVGSITGPIADVIRAPAEMAAVITGSIHNISTLVAEPERALNIYKTLFKAGDESQSVPTNTSNRQQQAANIEGMHALVQRTAIAEAAKLASTTTFASGDDAIRWRNNINTAIDAQLEFTSAVDGASINDEVYQSLMALRAAITTDLNTRGAKLPRLMDYVLSDTRPVLVIAHELYGEAGRAEEIITRNNIAHPLFVEGGTTLKVLSNE